MQLLEMKIDNIDTIDFKRIDRLRKIMQNRKASLCSERAKIYTEVFKETEEEPMILRKAKGLSKTLNDMSIYHLDDSLIFGNQASRNFAAPIFPEYSIKWLLDEVDSFEYRDGDVFNVSDEVKKDLREIGKYWINKTHEDNVNNNIPKINLLAEKQKVLHRGGISNSGDGHIVSDHKWLLEIGYSGMVDLINEKLKNPDLSDNQINFYNASKMTLIAGLNYAKRFANYFKEKAKLNNDKKLYYLSEIANKVLDGPCESFHEALQAIYLNHVFLMIESNGHSFCYGRIDQYLYPYYQNDIKKGVLTKARALELITHFFIMNNSLNKIRSNGHTLFSQGYPLYTNVMVGGLLPSGEDGTNDLTYLSVEAMGLCRLNEPNFSMRYHKESPKEILSLASKLIRTGCGMPSMFNDATCIKGLIDLGIDKEDAYDYVAIGCVETGVQGKYGHRATGMTYMNWGKILEIVLNRGFDPNTNIRLFKLSKEPKSYEELWNDWKKALAFYSELSFESDRVCDRSLEIYDSSPLGSIFIHNSLELGKTLKEGGCEYDVVSQSNIGSSVVGNSLMVLKKLVFEDKKYTYSQIMEALKNNWQDEEIHKACLEVEKFGNNSDQVDLIVKDVFDSYLELLDGVKTIRYNRGPKISKYTMSTSNITSYIPNGKNVGATPDGRMAQSPLNEGCSPTQNTVSKGLTALINSVSVLPNEKVAAGQLLNTRISYQLLNNEEKIDKFISFLRVSAKKGIYHNQFNVVSNKVLKDAQKHPENHRDLIVRVAGYCAQFVALTPEAQEAIIQRNEYGA